MIYEHFRATRAHEVVQALSDLFNMRLLFDDVQDFDVRWEVDGLPLFAGAQLAVDTTLVSALHANGEPHRGAAAEDGVALVAARRRKERTYPELVGLGRCARLVVLAVEVGGRWSRETQIFLSLLARARGRREGFLMRKRVEQAWRLQWGSLLSCTVARAVAMSLLELPGTRGADGVCPPTHEVERDFRYVGLAS